MEDYINKLRGLEYVCYKMSSLEQHYFGVEVVIMSEDVWKEMVYLEDGLFDLYYADRFKAEKLVKKDLQREGQAFIGRQWVTDFYVIKNPPYKRFVVCKGIELADIIKEYNIKQNGR